MRLNSVAGPCTHGSALHCSPGSGSGFEIRIQLLEKLLTRAEIYYGRQNIIKYDTVHLFLREIFLFFEKFC
jgi:hypothetical protein